MKEGLHMKILMKYVHHGCAFICKLIVSVTNRTGICPPAERPSVVSKDRLSVVPHRGLRCMSIYQCGGEGTYKRHSNTQVRVKLRAINDR